MNIKDDYEKLYQHWLKEFKKKDITSLSEEIFNEYIKSLDFLNEAKLDEKTKGEHKKIGSMIISSYKDNYKFLFKDLLKIREIKILNSALLLQEIDINYLLEAERLFYKNLVSDIKGYKKVKALSLEVGDLKVEAKKILELKELQSSDSSNIEKYEKDQMTEDIYENFISKNKELKYILIRFLKETPPLVGVDLINYGPFDKENIAFIPLKNARILINEKFAEQIEL